MKKLILSILLMSAFSASALAMTYDQAKNSGKTMVIMFKMRGCSACKQFEPVFDRAETKYSKKFNFVKEDYNNSQIASKFNFQTVPALYMYNPKTQQSQKIQDNDMWAPGSFENFLDNYNK